MYCWGQVKNARQAPPAEPFPLFRFLQSERWMGGESLLASFPVFALLKLKQWRTLGVDRACPALLTCPQLYYLTMSRGTCGNDACVASE